MNGINQHMIENHTTSGNAAQSIQTKVSFSVEKDQCNDLEQGTGRTGQESSLHKKTSGIGAKVH